MDLFSNYSYDFSLNEWDAVEAWCDADGDLKVFDSSGNLLFSLEELWDDSTIGTIYEDWSPPLDGYYYLQVLGWDFLGYQTPMSYCLAYRGQPIGGAIGCSYHSPDVPKQIPDAGGGDFCT
jgi:hypothetical protein